MSSFYGKDSGARTVRCNDIPEAVLVPAERRDPVRLPSPVRAVRAAGRLGDRLGDGAVWAPGNNGVTSPARNGTFDEEEGERHP
ncbi:hypothetical protein [Streptomyces sp. NPDC056480]|uniref:hypothetical protein n=1 Tax=Streptomyces sp. NPDC056480 TaxID=3345833 RepID=UPI0036B981CB